MEGLMKIKVPEGMLKAATDAIYDTSCPQRMFPDYLIEAALACLDARLCELKNDIKGPKAWQFTQPYKEAIEDVRRLFRDPEPEVPESVKDLLFDESHERRAEFRGANMSSWSRPNINNAILEAYRRGLSARDEYCREGSTGTSTPTPTIPNADGADSRKRR